MLRILAFIYVLFAAQAANAACNPANRAGVPFNCDAGNIPSSSDLFLGGSLTGNNAKQTVAFTGGQIIAMDHSLSPVTAASQTKTLAAWMLQLLNLQSTPITIGGQAVFPGGVTANQGNGSLLALASGTFVAGNCRQTDANGNEVDSGAPCGGGSGGSGAVTSGTAKQLAYYAASGTTVAGLATANNGVLVTSAAGLPSVATTLPSGLIIPSPTVSGANLTGTTAAGVINAAGRVSTTASIASGAGFNVAQGVAPTAPINGDIWVTASAINVRVNGATVALGAGGSGLSSVTANTPLAGAGTVASPLTCTTCATTTTGGALTATAPVTINSGGLIALGVQPGAAIVQWPTSVNVTADTYYFTLSWPWASGTITKLVYATGGTTPSFSVAVQIAGSSVTGCSGITVTSATITTATCTAANTVTTGQKVTLAVSAVSGTPNAAQVQINYTRSAN